MALFGPSNEKRPKQTIRTPESYIYYTEEHLTSELKHINIDTHLTRGKVSGKNQDAAIVL